MNRKPNPLAATVNVMALLVALLPGYGRAAEPTVAALRAFDEYTGRVEGRLESQHRSASGFMAVPDDSEALARLRTGEPLIENLAPRGEAELPGAMLHHWRGTAFVPGATAAEFVRLMRGFEGYPRIYAPEVLASHTVNHDGERYRVAMRVAQKHVITVVMDTDYDVVFSELVGGHVSSISRSTRVGEIGGPGTSRERTLTAEEAHGFLWRLNTYWSAEERDGGLMIQIESVTLTRAIPTGLGWAIGPFVESVPRDSLEFTLTATRKALRR